MRLTQQTRNAIHILIYCSERSDLICRISDIASACNITEFNTFKLVPILVQGQFLISIRGRYGGVKLALRPEDISIGAVVRTTEKITAQQGRLTQKTNVETRENSDLFQTMMVDAFETFLQTLDEHTIADFLTNKQLDNDLPPTAANTNQPSEPSTEPPEPVHS